MEIAVELPNKTNQIIFSPSLISNQESFSSQKEWLLSKRSKAVKR